MHSHCASAAWVACQPPRQPKGGRPQDGAANRLLIDVSADLLTADTGPILLMSSVLTPASLRARLGRRQVLRNVQLLHTRRISVLSCTGSPEAGEAIGPSLWVVHLLSEQRVVVAILRVHLKPPPVVHPRGRAGICAGQLPRVPAERCAGSRRQECPTSSLETCWCADVQTSHAEITDSSAPVGHGGAAPSRYRCTLPGPLLLLRGQDLRHRQGRAASLWGWSPRTPSSARPCARCRSRIDASALPDSHHRPADASPPSALRVSEEVSPHPLWLADTRG